MNKITFLKSLISIDPNTYLLLHCDGANGSAAYVDSSSYGRTVTAYGGAVQSTARSKFGSASSLHDGDGDYLSISGINFGTGAFCIECFMYLTSTSSANDLLSYGGLASTATTGFGLRVASSLLFLSGSSGRITGTTPSLNAWHHVAVVGNGGADGARNVKLYVDGTLIGTYTVNYNYTGKVLTFGADAANTSYCIYGNIDEVRVSVGTERYTGNFTPPTSAYLM